MTTWGQLPIVDIYDPNVTWAEDPDNGSFIGIQYMPSGEDMQSIGSPKNNLFREVGVCMIHVIAPNDVSVNDTLSKLEEIRLYLRGTELPNFTIYEVDPPQFGEGASIKFEGLWYGGVISFDYRYSFNA